MRMASLFIVILTASCVGVAPTRIKNAPVTETLQTEDHLLPSIKPTSTSMYSPTSESTAVNWDVYHPDADHLWNRLFRQFYRRTTLAGKEYGREALDPLLWYETTAPLTEPSYLQTTALLDKFLSSHGEELITDPLKRAMFQRDLWVIFDWLARRSDNYPDQRQALQSRIARVIRNLALTSEQIQALPDNYQLAILSGIYPAQFDRSSPLTAFLPPDLLRSEGEWVCLGRDGGPVASSHIEGAPFFGRSVFFVFMRLPGGRKATLHYLEALNTQTASDVPGGSEVALVRRMMLIDDHGTIVPSPITESVQIRHYETSQVQRFFEYTLNRERLFKGEAGGLFALGEADRDFILFNSHEIDPFEIDPEGVEHHMGSVLSSCPSCHSRPDIGVTGANSILSYNRKQFLLPEGQQPILKEITSLEEAKAVIRWKLMQDNWLLLQRLWSDTMPPLQ